MATSRMTEQLGRVLGGRYRLIAGVGRGASAQVFLADDVVLRRRVAVKVLHPALADDEAFLRRFRAEARAAAALSHPNLMAVYDWGEDDGPYLVLEYLGGGSLRALLDQGGRLSPAQAVVVGLDAARALDVAHKRGFVHRDIKPANLLFGDDQRLRIADFGLARALSEAAWTEPGDVFVGTARYGAPEQASGGRVDDKADVYALALVLIESVTGSVPLTADTALGTLLARVNQTVPVPAVLGPLVPALERAGHPDPAERPDAAHLGRSLLAVARTLDRPEPLPLAGAVDVSLLRELEEGDETLLPAPRPKDPVVVVEPPPIVVDDEEEDGRRLSRRERRRERRQARLAARGGRRRRRWPWVLLALLLVTGSAGGAYAWYEALPPSARVPDVDELPLASARAALAAAQQQADEPLEWRIVLDERFDEQVASGAVIDQQPSEGTDLDDGGTVRLIVSRGPPPVALPALEGVTEEQAGMLIPAADLVLGSVTGQPSEDVEEGRVVTWSAAGEERPAEAPKGSRVDLVVSDGPAPRIVPPLTGRPQAEAEAALRRLGLQAVVTPEFSNDVARGNVIRTEPGAGASVERGRQIAVFVSQGPDLVVVPEVAGLSLQEAIQAITGAGLRPGDVTGPSTGSPYTTSPNAGASVVRGTEVRIFLR